MHMIISINVEKVSDKIKHSHDKNAQQTRNTREFQHDKGQLLKKHNHNTQRWKTKSFPP